MTQFYTKPHISFNFAFPWLMGVDKVPVHYAEGLKHLPADDVGLHPFIPTMTVHGDGSG